MGSLKKLLAAGTGSAVVVAVLAAVLWGGAASAEAATDVPSVKLTATPSSVTYPAIVTLSALASNIDTTVAKFEVRSADSTLWTPLAGPVDSTTGQFKYLYFPKKNSYYRVIVGDVQTDGTLYVPVRTNLSKPVGNATAFRVGQQLRMWGTIRPYHPVGDHPDDVKYYLYWQKYSYSLRRWVACKTATPLSITSVVDNDTTKWSYGRAMNNPGLWRVRFYHQCPRHAATYSPWLTYRVTN